MTRSRFTTAAAWLTPTWLVLAWLHQGLLAGEVFFKRDTLLVFLPLKKWLAEGFARGELAEWWPFDGLGQPLTSLPIASAFHPTTLLYAALPLAVAFTLQTLIPLVLLPVGTWQLARTVGLRGPGAALASAVVGVSFWNVLLAEQTQMHLAAASLPWFWREALRLHRSRRGSPVVLALATANLVVGGDPMLLELAGVCLVPLLWRWPLRLGALLRVAAPLLLGVGLGGVQLAPMALAWLDSPRSLGLGLTVDDYWALRWPLLAGVVLPVHHGTDYLFDTLYLGLPTVALAGAGLASRWRLGWRWLAVLLLLVVTAFGRQGGLWHAWSALLPGWRGFQYPVKALGPAVLPLALLAGRGLQAGAWRRRVAVASGLSGVTLLALGATSAVLQLAAGLVLVLRARRPALHRPLAVALVLLLSVDVGLQLRPAPTWPFAQVETAPELAKVLAAAGVGLEGALYEWSYAVPESMDQRLPRWRSVQTEFQVLTAAPDTGALFGLPTSRAYLAGVTRRVFALRQESDWQQRLAPIFGVAARVEAFPAATPPTPNLGFDADLGAAVVPVIGARPRAYVAFDWVLAEESPAIGLLRGAAVQQGAVVLPAGVLAGRGVPGRPLQPVALARRGDTLELDVALDAPGVLVVNEAWSRGWSATVDGAAQAPLLANAAVLGVPLAAGAHHVRLVYSTPLLVLGLGVSAGCAALLAVVARLSRRRRREVARRATSSPAVGAARPGGG